MPTVIDSLVVVLGLDPKQFTEGQKKAAESLRRTEVEASRVGKNIEHSGAGAAEFFGRMRNQALALFAVFAGGRGLQEFAVTTTNVAAATGRLAHNLGISTEELSAWQIAAKQFAGGSAEAVAASLTNLSQSLTAGALTGNSPLIQFFRVLGVHTTDANNKVRSLSAILLDVSSSPKFRSMTPAQQVFFGHQIGLDDGTINLLQKGRPAVEAALAKAREEGVISKQQTEAFQKLQTAATGASTALDALGRLILEKLSPIIISVLNAISKTKPLIDGWNAITDPNNYQFHSDAPTPPAIAAIGNWWRGHMPAFLGGASPTHTADTTMSPAQRAFLDSLSMGESKGYNEGNPRDKNGNVLSTAHGRYQFLDGTDADVSAKTGINGQDPVSQDRKAWYLAATTYKSRTGRDLEADLKAGGHDAQIAGALNGVWPSLPGGSQQNTTMQQWQRHMTDNNAAYGPQAIQTGAPNEVDTVLNRIRAQRGGDVTNNAGGHSEVHIGAINVHTKATDAKGIAAGIGGALRSNPLVPMANTGLVY